MPRNINPAYVLAITELADAVRTALQRVFSERADFSETDFGDNPVTLAELVLDTFAEDNGLVIDDKGNVSNRVEKRK